MPRVVYAGAPIWAGIRHRFMTLNHAKTFAGYFGYTVHFLWGVSGGVGYCRFEELLEPIPGVHMVNVTAQELSEVERLYERSRTIRFRGEPLSVFRAGSPLTDRMLAYDVTGYLHASNALEQLVPLPFRPPLPQPAIPCSEIQRNAGAYVRKHHLMRRMGIRVRVTESPNDGRTLRRYRRELNETIRSIIRMPWYVPVFVVTDSEYIQQMLASHFHDARFLPKNFNQKEVSGGYIDRDDRAAVKTFVTEVACLMACRKIVNIGGFINEESVWEKMVQPPYDAAVFGQTASS